MSQSAVVGAVAALGILFWQDQICIDIFAFGDHESKGRDTEEMVGLLRTPQPLWCPAFFEAIAADKNRFACCFASKILWLLWLPRLPIATELNNPRYPRKLPKAASDKWTLVQRKKDRARDRGIETL